VDLGIGPDRVNCPLCRLIGQLTSLVSDRAVLRWKGRPQRNVSVFNRQIILLAQDCIYAAEHATHPNGRNRFSDVLVASHHSAQSRSPCMEHFADSHRADYGACYLFVERRMAMAFFRVAPGWIRWDLLWLQALVANRSD